ncbi:hypothetical protein K2X33_10035 [bacterium]|nr:hypothetical protein [bacterium]
MKFVVNFSYLFVLDLWQHHPLGFSFLLQLFLGLVALCIAVPLSFYLNPRFDPYLKKYLSSYFDMMPVLTDRFLRTMAYAGGVANKRFFAMNRPEMQAVDFRTGVSRALIFFSWVHSLLIVSSALLLVINLVAFGLHKYFAKPL